MREAAINLSKRLAQTAQETFVDFEEAVEKDATKTTVMDGTVHPLTSYVINYVKFLYEWVISKCFPFDCVCVINYLSFPKYFINTSKRISRNNCFSSMFSMIW